MFRRSVDVTEPIPGEDLATATAHLVAARDRLEAGRRGVQGDLRIRLADDGQVQLRQVFGTYTYYPRTTGRLERTAEGRVHLVGTARESLMALVWVVMFGFPTLVTLIGLAASIADQDVAGIVVCLPGSLALGAIVWVTQRSRRELPQDVEQQLDLLRRALAGRP